MMWRQSPQRLGQAERGEAIAASPRERTFDGVDEQTVGTLQTSAVVDQQQRGRVESVCMSGHGPDAREDRRRHEHVVGPSLAVLRDAILLSRGGEASRIE